MLFHSIPSAKIAGALCCKYQLDGLPIDYIDKRAGPSSMP